MTKLPFRSQASAFLLFFTVIGCGGAGLEQPTSPEPALALNVHLVAPAPQGTTEIGVRLREIPYCPASYLSLSPAAMPSPVSPAAFESRPFDPTATTMHLSAATSGDPRAFGCGFSDIPLVRFFQPELYLLPVPGGTGPAVPWIAGDTIVAYVGEPVSFTSFGPGDVPLALAPGYTVLKRSCGAFGSPWDLARAPADQPIDFHPPALAYYPQPLPPPSTLLEQSERALLRGCGVQSPPIEAGKPVTFGRATSLALRSGGTELLFMLPIDPLDPAQGAPLRSVNLVDGTVRQLAAVGGGRSIQVTDSGDIYVVTETKMLRADLQPDGSAIMRELPLRGVGNVSPDGRWIVYPDFLPPTPPAEPSPVFRVWDVAAGSANTRLAPGLFPVGWSPTSLLLTIETGTGQSGSFIDVVSPTDGQSLERFNSILGGFEVVWGHDRPIVLGSATRWSPQLPTMPPQPGTLVVQGQDFGLRLEDPQTGSIADVLDVNAGSTIAAVSADGLAFVWTRTCLGLYETACSFALHRLTVPEGDDQIVAVSDRAGPVAISADGHRVAIATNDGIFVRDR